MILEILFHQGLGIVDGTDGRDSEGAQMRAHEQRLRVGVRDASDGARAVEAHDVVLEFRAERRVLDRVNLTLVAILVVKHDHARSTRAEMRVVIDAEENIHHHVALGNRSEKAAHEILRLSVSTIGQSINGAPERLLPCG